MAYQLRPTAPLVSLDIDKLEHGIANLIDAKGWTTDAEFNAGINAMTDAQAIGAFKAFLKALVKLT